VSINYLYFGIALLAVNACTRPIAQFAVKSAEPIAPAAVTVTNESQKAETYEWDFGDGKKSTDIAPNHVYKASGNYTITLKATKAGKSNKTTQNVFVKPPSDCTVEIETEFGNMIAILYNATPQHRDNFLKLSEENFYNNLLFHRVINGFMVQGGDPESRNAAAGMPLGSGGPGYQIPAEFVDSLVHIRGALAAARTNNPKKESSGSQFYIVHGKPVNKQQLDYLEANKGLKYSAEQRKIYMETGGTPFLDKEYTVFGRIVKGFDVLEKIATTKTAPGDRPMQDVSMKIRVVK
jgi:cyclophilin family peptidyl-prolyl cis-trans isomerase